MGRVENAYVVVDCGHDYCSDHHQPICDRNIDLTVECFRCMIDFNLREVRKFHDLTQQLYSCQWSLIKQYPYATNLISPGDDRLACNDAGQDSHDKTGPEHARRNGQIEWVCIGTGINTDVGSLADVLFQALASSNFKAELGLPRLGDMGRQNRAMRSGLIYKKIFVSTLRQSFQIIICVPSGKCPQIGEQGLYTSKGK